MEYTTPLGNAIATSQAEVEATLSALLKTCFTRAHGSPFLKPPLAPLVGDFGTGKVAQDILNGTFTCPPNLNNHTCLFIEALQFPLEAAQQAKVPLIL